MIGFEELKEQYEGDPDLKEIVQRCVNGVDPKGEFLWHDGYLFRGGQLCIPTGSPLRDQFISELHGGVLGGHCGVDWGQAYNTLVFTILSQTVKEKW